MLISEVLLRSMEAYADRLALVTEQGSATYRQLFQMATGNIKAWQKAGIQPGMCVVLAGGSSLEFLTGFWALQLIGAVPALMNPGYTPAEVNQAANTVGAAYVLAGAAEVDILRRELPAKRILPILLDREISLCFEPYGCNADQIGLIRFTSGTTGLPKAVAYSHHNLTWGAPEQQTPDEPGTAFLCPISLSIRFGRFFRALGVGATIFALEAFCPRKVVAWSAYRSLKRIWASPVMLKRLMTEVDDRRIFCQVSGFSSVGSYLPPVLQQEFQDKFGVPVYQYYGQKESISLVEMPDDASPVLDSVGKPVSGTEVRIDHPDEHGQGEIQYRSERAAPGYIEDGHFKPRIAMPGGWFGTGDIGFTNSQGYLFVRGRSSSFINVGGLKVAPAEIEAVLCQFPGVCGVKIDKVANYLLGEVPVAYVAIPGAGAETLNKIRQFCRERMAKHKVPRRIILLEELAINAVGKLQ